MIVAADTSTLIAYIQGNAGVDVEHLDSALADGVVCLPPVVLTEALSDPVLPIEHRKILLALPTLPLLDGYWVRTAETRAAVLARGLRARLPDTLIAQSCIDHGVPLIARDGDFRHFAAHCGLQLARRY